MPRQAGPLEIVTRTPMPLPAELVIPAAGVADRINSTASEGH
jgi:hypothetical protein